MWTAGWYDGGSPGIPGDITGTVGRVMVAGAGIAGLATANALTHAGVECVVLEARDRIGGRLHAVDMAGTRCWSSSAPVHPWPMPSMPP
jgi:polyamine oxidase